MLPRSASLVQLPHRLTPRRAAMLVAAVASTLPGEIAFASRFLFNSQQFLFDAEQRLLRASLLRASILALAGGAAMWRTVGRRARALTAAGWGALCGASVAAAAVLPQPAMPHTTGFPWTMDLLLVLVFAVPAAIVGAVFGLTSLLVARPAADAERAPSFDGLERVLFPGSIWVAVMGGLALSAGRLSGAAALGAAVLALAFVLTRDVRRVLWLRAVVRGLVPGWAIVAGDRSLRAAPRVPMLARYEDAPVSGRLARRETGAGASPFRQSGVVEPVAEIPGNFREAISPFVWRSALSFLVASLSVWWAYDGLASALRP